MFDDARVLQEEPLLWSEPGVGRHRPDVGHPSPAAKDAAASMLPLARVFEDRSPGAM
jgi:hypothetical protein